MENNELVIHIMNGYDTLETEEGSGFGVYIKEKNEIYVAGNLELYEPYEPNECENCDAYYIGEENCLDCTLK